MIAAIEASVGSDGWLESLGRDERMAVVKVFAGLGHRAVPPVEKSALVHLRWLVSEVERLEALLAKAEVKP